MRTKKLWTIQSFISCFFWNALLLVVFYIMAGEILQGIRQWIDPFLQSGTSNLPEDARSAFSNLSQFFSQIRQYLAPALFGIGGSITLALWLSLVIQGRGLAARAERAAAIGVSPTSASEKPSKEEKIEKPTSPEGQEVQPSPQSAIQILSILQREGRLVDFLQEDLSAYDDSQIGAAVRSIHQGCRAALAEHVELKPIFDEGEGGEVTVPPDFDSRAIRLTGNVTGNPPFKGILRHRGWRVERLELPQFTLGQKKDWVLAPAEVEVGE